MKVIDLNEEQENAYFLCLEDWSEEMNDAGTHKEAWYRKMVGKGLRVKLAQDDEGKTGGMIQYLPIEHSFVQGEDLYVVYCIWVHGYKHGRGNFQKRGMGKALLQAAEADVREVGAKGIVAWGISLPFWMRASWFKKQGYKKVEKTGMQVLLWKPFSEDAVPPSWIKPKRKPEALPGKVAVKSFINGWCPAQNMTYERAKRAAGEFDHRVVFSSVDTSDRETFLQWGISDALYIDGKKISTGPPPSYEKLKKLIARRVKRLR
jgi:GNAT superfamily N-acetyltransferase